MPAGLRILRRQRKVDPETVQRFAKLPVANVSDSMSRLTAGGARLRPKHSGGVMAGPALTVKAPPGDNLMLHAAIYRAPAGSVIVVEAGDVDYAVAGGNVCAVAQKNGIAGFVVDGVIRDLAEVREKRFP